VAVEAQWPVHINIKYFDAFFDILVLVCFVVLCEVIVSVICLQGTASEATFVALLAARSKTATTIKNDDKTAHGHVLSQLVAYCSDQVTENQHNFLYRGI